MFIIQPSVSKQENHLELPLHHRLLYDMEAISGLAVLLEKREFFQKKHLLVSTSKNLEKLQAFLHFKKPKLPWFVLPPFPVAKSFYSESIRRKRLRWQSWAGCDRITSGLFLVTPQALLKKTDVSLKKHIITKDSTLSADMLELYKETAFVERMGEYSSRAFLMDIFSPAYETPLRVQLMGSKVQSIHLLDREFKRREKELDQALISPLSEWNFEGTERKNLCHYLRQQEDVLSYTLPPDVFKNVSLGKCPTGFEHLLNCLNKTCSLDFFPEKPCTWLFDPECTKDSFLERTSKLAGEHPFFTEENLFLPWEKLESGQNDFSYVYAKKQAEKKTSLPVQDKQVHTVTNNVQRPSFPVLSINETNSSPKQIPEKFFLLLQDFSVSVFKKSKI